MRKKFTMLLMSLLAFVGVAKAGVTDLPQMSTGDDIKWYTISNTRSESGKYLYWTESGVKDSNTGTGASFFYVTGSADACYIHNYATDLLFSGNGAWTKDGVACKLSVSPDEKGLMIGFNGTYLNEQNYDNGFTTWDDINDAGSIFVFEEVTDFSAIIDVPAAKTAAIAEINNYAVVSTLYPATTEAVAAVNAVTPNSNGLKDLNDAVEAINAIVVGYRENAYQALAGKYFTIQTLTTERTKGFMQMATSNVVGSEAAASPANIWQFVCSGNGTVNVYNPYTGKYLCEPQGNSSNITVTTDKASAGAYVLNVNNTNPAVAEAKVKLTSNGKSVHMAGGHTLVRWDNGGASEWQVVEVKDFSSIINSYKAASTATLDSWATLSVVSDAALINAAKTAIDGIATTDWATFAAIDAQLKNVTDKVAEKYFTFKNDDKATAARVDAYLAANASTKKGYGTKTFDYSAIWRLLSAGGTSFYLYNELNDVYLKNPGSGDLVDDAAQAATYTFEIIDAATNKAELKSGNETLHLAKACSLMSYDENDPASRWYIATYDYKADLNALLESVNEDDYADVPALGQYPTAAFNALVEANENATTVVEVAEAIAAFKAAKNLPVFTINGAGKDYAKGKSVYDDNDGAPAFKTTDIYDKTMWWALDLVETTVSATGDNYIGIYNVGTGNGFWGQSTIKIAATSDAKEGVFLFYTPASGNTVHFQETGSTIVYYNSTGSDTGSATSFTYLGNSYDLSKLTDDKIAALKELENTVNAKAYLVSAQVGSGAGQYQGDYDAFYEKFYTVDQLLTNGTLTSKASLTVEEISQNKADIETLAAALVLNAPVNGTYFRIQGANSEITPAGWYITGHTNADGGRIALNSEADASTIYYYNEGKLQAYVSGKYIALNKDHFTFDKPAEGDKAAITASVITFAASPRVAGAYTIMSADRYLHYKSISEDEVEIDRCDSDEALRHDWYLVEVEKETITYTYKAGETVLATQEVTEFAGMPYPAADVVLPLGYTATALTGNIVKDETAKDITCELNEEAIPFEYYDSYANVEQWYYLNFAKDQNFLYYAEDNTVLDATQTAIDRANREAYAWAFIGTPATGFQVVNKAAGAEKGLEAAEAGAVVATAGQVFKLTASTYATGGFFMAAVDGDYTERFNKQNNQVVYWDGADAGSTFTVTECPFGAVAELEALIVDAEALNTTVDANTGDKIGEYAVATGEALATAIETAKTKGDAATAEDVTALQAAMDAVKIILPTAGKYYQFHSAVAFADTKAVYSGEGKALWKTLNDDDKVFYWEAVENEGGIALKNAKDGKFLNGNAGQSGAWSVSDTPVNIDVIIITKEDNENGYQYGLVLNNWQMHANQHGEGSGTAGNIVSWNNTEVGKASAWYIKEVELPEFCNIVYEFKHEGVTIDKFTQRAELKAGAEFPEIAISLPYGVSTNATKPDGTVTTSQTFEFTLNIDKALPFETAADAAGITTWYYMQMHVFNASYLNYIQDCDTYVEWADNNVTDEEIDSHLWGFVGSIWDGVQVVNKATNKAIVSTGSGDATMGDAGTVFMPTHSANAGNADYFCLQHASGNYLNAQGDRIKHYGQNDNGSTFFVTEAGKEFSVTVNAEAGYSTYYSNYRLAIPETVKAYIIDEVDGKSINLTQVEGVLPANTGVILEGAGTHTFVISAAKTTDVSRNLLKGTATRTLITPAANTTCYVLANLDNGVGLYKADLAHNEGTAFYNGANKAYLPVVAETETPDAEAPAMFAFTRGEEGDDSTGIENVESNEELVIYDLAGRRVQKMEKGIYIVNGRKVVIK